MKTKNRYATAPKKKAQAELEEHFKDMREAVAAGDMHDFEESEYRIAEVTP